VALDQGVCPAQKQFVEQLQNINIIANEKKIVNYAKQQ
jgi:hypothetical protein